MKNNNIKVLLSTTLATSLLATSLPMAFAQNYNYPVQNYSTNPGANYQPPVTEHQLPHYQLPHYQQQQQRQFSMPALKGHVIVIPAGAHIGANVGSQISSEFLTVGDSISLNMGSPFFFQGAMIAPVNSLVNGSVVVAEKAGRGGKHGKLKIKFTDILTPDGRRIPIAGKIQTEDNTGMLVGGTNKDRAKKMAKETAVGAAGGALSGLIFGAASGGKAGKGAAVGTAIGSGIGLGKSLWDKGEDVSLNPGSFVDIIIEQPITINPAQ